MMNAQFLTFLPMPRKLKYRTRHSVTGRPSAPLATTLIILGATDTFEFIQVSGAAFAIMVSIASLMTSIPVGWLTSRAPKYCAFNTFLGSSIGVGNDWAAKQNEMLICWSFRSPGLVNFLRWRTHRRFSVGRSVGRVAAPPRSKLLKESPLRPLDDPSSCNERSIMMRLQMSRKVLAITRAAVSHRNTWHMWILVRRSRATYAKSLKDRKSINFSNSPQYRTIVSCIPLSDRGDASVYIQHVTRTMASMEDNEKKGHSNVVKYGECCKYLTHLPLSLPTPQTRIVWIGWVFNTVKFSGSISFKAPSSKSMNRSLPWN